MVDMEVKCILVAQSQIQTKKRVVAEKIWLHYYNRVLYERGMISEEERNRMSNRIDQR